MVDDRTVKISLSKPNAGFLQILSNYRASSILAKSYLALDFNARGIPNVLFCEEDASGPGWPVPLHAVEDCLEQVDPDRLTSICELAANTFEELFRAVAG